MPSNECIHDKPSNLSSIFVLLVLCITSCIVLILIYSFFGMLFNQGKEQ